MCREIDFLYQKKISYFYFFCARFFFLCTEIQFIIIKWLKLLYFIFLLHLAVLKTEQKQISDNLILFNRVIYDFEIKEFLCMIFIYDFPGWKREVLIAVGVNCSFFNLHLRCEMKENCAAVEHEKGLEEKKKTGRLNKHNKLFHVGSEFTEMRACKGRGKKENWKVNNAFPHRFFIWV